MLKSQIERVESGLKRVSARIPELPSEELLIGRIIVLLGRDLSAMLDRALRPHGLAEPDFRVLMALFSHEEASASPSELCARVAHSPANMTRIADTLVARGLITRVLSEKDRRRMVLRMTSKGRALVSRLLPRFFEPMRQAFAGLSADEKKQITARLKRVAAALDGAASENGQ